MLFVIFLFQLTTFLLSTSSLLPSNPSISFQPNIPPPQTQSIFVPCSECQKILSIYITSCNNQELQGQTPLTLFAFCEYSKKHSNPFNINTNYCYYINQELSNIAGLTGNEYIDTTKSPLLCSHFQYECNKHKSTINCFSGLCDTIIGCIDCPTALIDRTGNGNFQKEVCGLSGYCRIGWRNTKGKGGNGYCECINGMKGLACNEY